MALGTNQLTPTTSAVFIPEVWSREVIRAAEDALVMAPLCKRYDADVSQRGDIIHIPNISNLSANDKVVNTQITLQSPTESENTITIDQHKEVSFLVEDITKVQADYNLLSEYTKKAGFALAEAVDTALLALYSSLTSTDVGTYGTDITDATILAALQTLDEVNAPITERYFVIKPSQKTAIAKLDKFVKADYLGKVQEATPVKVGPNSRYEWGDIYGVPVFYTNQITSTSATPTQTHNICFHKEAFALAMQQKPRTQSSYVLEYLGNLVVVDELYGVSALRATFGVEVRS